MVARGHRDAECQTRADRDLSILAVTRWPWRCCRFRQYSASADAATATLAPHRAIYDLKLQKSQGRRPVEAVRGRILYDFAGNELRRLCLPAIPPGIGTRRGEGKVTFSDLRATTWEDGSGQEFPVRVAEFSR